MEYQEIGFEPDIWMRLLYIALGLILLAARRRGKNAISARWTFVGAIFAAACPVMSIGVIVFYFFMLTGGIVQMHREKASPLMFWGASALSVAVLGLWVYLYYRTTPGTLMILEDDQLIIANASPARRAPRSKVQVTAVADSGERPTNWFISGDGMPKPGRSMRWLGTSYWYRSSDGRFLRGDAVAREVAEWAHVEIGRETWEEAHSP